MVYIYQPADYFLLRPESRSQPSTIGLSVPYRIVIRITVIGLRLSTKLGLNLRTENRVGLTIPPNVLARADKVIK